MADRVHIVLKTGDRPKPGGADKRTAYDGRVKKGVGTSFRDDRWTRTPCGQEPERLAFALHISEGYLADVIQEYCEFKAAYVSGDAEQTFEEFLNALRSRYLDEMPDGHDGFVFFLIEKDKRLYNGVSKPVTHRHRHA
jgi:hypothetical protein